VLGRGIINGCLAIVGATSKVFGVGSGGTLYLRPRVFRRISSSLVRRILRSTGFQG
jgi:hypothetical protein